MTDTDCSDDYDVSLPDKIFNQIFNELKKKKYKDKIMNDIIEPLLNDINSKYYPHFIYLTTMLILIIILLIGVLALSFYN
tara:strand:- start:263 stop:502 length:240 start_codon:yes stop_codon:yes gene_type:complete